MTAREPQAPGKSDREEAEFLATYDPNAYERPSLAVDVNLVSAFDGGLQVLLTQRPAPPHKDRWALPGGFVGIDEPVDAAALRVLHDKVGVHDAFIEQLYTFGAVQRDPRMRIISVAYLGLLPPAALLAAAERRPELRVARLAVDWTGEAGGVATAQIEGAPVALAFDHGDMLGLVVQRLRGKLDYTPLAYEMLPPTFTLRDLQAVHESVHGRTTNKDSFRRRMLASGHIAPTGAREAAVGHRPAALYRWVQKGQ